MKRTFVKGSYTVEAALVFPIVIFVVIGVLYLAFYLHDKVKIQGLIDEASLKAKAYVRNETDINTGLIDYETYNKRGIFYPLRNDLDHKEEKMKEYLEGKLSSGLFIADLDAVEVILGYSDIDIEVSVDMDIPFFDVRQYFTGSGFSLRLKNTVPIQNPMEFIRIFSIFTAVASKIRIIDETLKKLHEILNKIK